MLTSIFRISFITHLQVSYEQFPNQTMTKLFTICNIITILSFAHWYVGLTFQMFPASCHGSLFRFLASSRFPTGRNALTLSLRLSRQHSVPLHPPTETYKVGIPWTDYLIV